MKALLWQKRWDSGGSLLSRVSFYIASIHLYFHLIEKLLSTSYMQNTLEDTKRSETYSVSPGAYDSVEEFAL